jgi:hypothetical protein
VSRIEHGTAFSSPAALFITGNGHGLGHLTRMLAVAKHAAGRFRPIFLTSSQAYSIVRDFGYDVEYLPSYLKLGMHRLEWEPVFGSRIHGLLRQFHPRAVVIDHINPPKSLLTLRNHSRGISFIWSRRGMWRKNLNREAMRLAPNFDVVIEPGDIAGPIDVGLTSGYHPGVSHVAPIVLVDPTEQMERSEARAVLGLPPNGRAILVQLTDSDPSKLLNLVREVRSVITSVTGGEDVHVFAPLHALHGSAAPSEDGVSMRPVYPVARYLRAFDGVVSTAGYNSFHETVASGLPAVVVSRDTDRLDDQVRRAEFIELCGRGFFAPSVTDPLFRRAVQRMLSSGESDVATATTRELGEFRGGAQFADIVAARISGEIGVTFAIDDEVGINPPSKAAVGKIRSGEDVPEGRNVGRAILVALGFDQVAFDRLVTQVAMIHERTRVVPLFLIDEIDSVQLEAHDFQYESLMSAREYADETGGEYDEYVQECVAGLKFRYRTEKVVLLKGDHTVDRLEAQLQASGRT